MGYKSIREVQRFADPSAVLWPHHFREGNRSVTKKTSKCYSTATSPETDTTSCFLGIALHYSRLLLRLATVLQHNKLVCNDKDVNVGMVETTGISFQAVERTLTDASVITQNARRT